MLEEVGKRHGATRGRFSFGRPSLGRRKQLHMTIVKKPPPVDLLAETEELYREAAEDLVRARRKLTEGRAEEVRAAVQAVKDLKVALQLVMDERARVERLRRTAGGIVHDYALDLEAARAEVGRRLARLRDAGAGG
ncbi:hypothetical protein C8J28_106198 [Cereibacter azotoformans]|uniref:Uncharacterized protein n=2 Tax=Cereibacter azotoformans TaxID=43057 RepID=A0A2T5K9F2_9RHOB|nr:hypothetical protein C8J28_106198 [Cereibacter azotoformans]